MKTSLRILALVSALLVGFQANAGLHLEPFVGYLMGKSDDGSTKEDIKGTDFGARIGYSLPLGLALGGEFSTSKFKIDSNPSVDVEPTNLGAFVAYEFPVLIRAYGTYIFSSKGDYGSGGIEAKGSGYRLGVGFTGLPFIAINLEYVNLKFDECSFAGGTCTMDVDSKMYGINVSLPLDLL